MTIAHVYILNTKPQYLKLKRKSHKSQNCSQSQ